MTCGRFGCSGPVEDRLGSARYLLLYFACGVIAALSHYQFNPTSDVPPLGPSGAIGGVIGCYVRLLPFSSGSFSCSRPCSRSCFSACLRPRGGARSRNWRRREIPG
ncbi:MAG: rhomboid family intramembrane serine protease [Hyphomicrobiales bacterium]|nr:rhomboid family intramembrane serine protease [Hyphomicrobiales bacterium]